MTQMSFFLVFYQSCFNVVTDILSSYVSDGMDEDAAEVVFAFSLHLPVFSEEMYPYSFTYVTLVYSFTINNTHTNTIRPL